MLSRRTVMIGATGVLAAAVSGISGGQAEATGPSWPLPVTPPNGVARAQIFDGGTSQADMLTYAGRVDFTWGARYLDWQPADVLPSRYVQPEIVYSHNPPTDWQQYDLAWFQANHPDWIMYRNDRTTPAYGSGTWVPIDLTNPAVRSWHFTTIIQPHIDLGWPVIAMDGMLAWNFTARAGHYDAAGAWVQQYTGATLDAQYADDKIDYVQWVVGQLHAQGIAAAGNIFMHRAATAMEYEKSLLIAAELDIVIDEGGIVAHGLTHGTNGMADQDWRDHYDYIRAISALGKAIAVVDETSVADGAAAPDSEVAYSVANYFLYKESGVMLYLGSHYGPFLERDELDTDIGVAAEPPVELSSGAWRRQYSDGLTLVNPTATPGGVTVTLPAGTYHDLSGATVTGSVHLDPVSGTVLTRV